MTSVFPKRYLLVTWLFVLSATAYLDRTNISIAGLQIAREYGVSNLRLGWVFSAFLIGYAAFQVPAGLLVHRFGSRRVLAAGAAWWALFTVLTAAVRPGAGTGLLLLWLVRFGLGAGEAVMYPATAHFVQRWFPAEERGRANGIVFAGVGAGSGLTPPLVTAIITAHGWRASFWFSAVIGLGAGAVWLLAARDTPTKAEDVRAVQEDGSRVGSPEKLQRVAEPRIGWLRAIAQRNVGLLAFSYFCFGYVAWVFFAWFYIYLAQVRGLDLKKSALYSTLPFLCMTVGCLFGGVLSDAIARRMGNHTGRSKLAATVMALTAMLVVAGSSAHAAATAGVLLALGAGVLYIAQSCFWAVSADTGGAYGSVAAGVMNMGGQIGGAVTTSLTPLLAAQFGWTVPFYVAGAMAVAGAVSWWMVRPMERGRHAALPPDAVEIEV